MCDFEFTLPSHCERHMTAAHSGFGHLCSTCGLFFTGRDFKHGCKNQSFQIVKRSTVTFTGEEAVEFETFQKSRSKFCIPFMKTLPPSNHNLFNKSAKRAILTETIIPKKKKRYAARPQQLQTQIPAFMDLELPRIPVAYQKVTDVPPTSSCLSSLQNEPTAIDETSKPADSLPECPAACEDKQEEPTPLENLAKDLHLSESTEPRQEDEISLLTRRSNRRL